MSVPVIIAIAVVPTIVLMIFIYFQDNHEKEPIGLLLKIFGLGVLSCIPVYFMEWGGMYVNDLVFGGAGLMYYFALAFFVVAPCEEFFKFMAAYLLTWRNKHFNYKFDGIVYCLFGSMGFAAIENVKYLLSPGMDVQMIVTTGIGRALLAIPCHAMCGIFMGYYYGNAKYLKSYGNRSAGRRSLFLGYLIAVSLHGFYDFCLFTGRVFFFILFAVFVVAADVFTIILIIKAKKRNEKMYEAPQYRQLWVDANPYQPYGGYAAPVYGGYNYANASGNPAGQTAPYAAPNYQSNTPPVVATGQSYNPEIVSQGTSYVPQEQYGSYVPPVQDQSTQYAPPIQDQGAQYAPQVQDPNAQYAPQVQDPNAQYAPQVQDQNTQYTSGQDQQNINVPPAEQQTQILMRTSQIHCPVCNTINYFNAFYCTSCGASLHQFNNNL